MRYVLFKNLFYKQIWRYDLT